MYEFETFAFLDVPKTGTTFINAFLREYCTERQIRKIMHRGVGAKYDPAKFYFISVRDPLDQYISLYSFGCREKGGLFSRSKKGQFKYLYDGTWNGFQSWLGFVLDPENAELLKGTGGEKSYPHVSNLVGIQSYRVLRLCVPGAAKVLRDLPSKNALRSLYHSRNVSKFTIRYENLRTDLAELVQTKLNNSVSDVKLALDYILNSQPLNSSDRVDRKGGKAELDGGLRDLLYEREWLLHECFGY